MTETRERTLANAGYALVAAVGLCIVVGVPFAQWEGFMLMGISGTLAAARVLDWCVNDWPSPGRRK